jgi:hypothetical protein
MGKMLYSTPVVKSEDVVLGVFGSYNLSPALSAKPKPIFNGWGWMFRFMRWK